MKISEEKMSLLNLAGGAAIERFDIALQEVADNIQDVNVDPKADRKIILTVTIKPDENREMGVIIINAESKLAKFNPVLTKSVLTRDIEGKGELFEINVPRQMTLFDLQQKKKENKIHA